jgi:hypothetical protein
MRVAVEVLLFLEVETKETEVMVVQLDSTDRLVSDNPVPVDPVARPTAFAG